MESPDCGLPDCSAFVFVVTDIFTLSGLLVFPICFQPAKVAWNVKWEANQPKGNGPGTLTPAAKSYGSARQVQQIPVDHGVTGIGRPGIVKCQNESGLCKQDEKRKTPQSFVSLCVRQCHPPNAVFSKPLSDVK